MSLMASGEKNTFVTQLRRGAQLHAEGQLEEALLAFENARKLQPDDSNAACANATLLSILARPLAAYKLLLGMEKTLLSDADGTANLAIAAESCGYFSQAKSTYQHALKLDPDHLRSLNNIGLMAARESNWASAIACARRCTELKPDDASYRQNLSDHLSGARRHHEALQVLDEAARRFPDDLDIRIRRIIVLAFNAEFEKSWHLEATLDTEGREYLLAFVSRSLALPISASPVDEPAPCKRDAFELYTWQAFEAMHLCDWRGNDKLTLTLRAVLAGQLDASTHMDWLAVNYRAQMLELNEDELTNLHGLGVATASHAPVPIPAFSPTRKTVTRQSDHRLHVGLVTHQLHNAQHLNALVKQLALHDQSRFAIHVYSSTRQPGLDQEHALRPHAASMVQIAHMSDIEVAGRIRLDQLDLFVDMASEPGTPKPNIAAMRVAPVQVCQTSWQRHVQAGPYEYTLSDSFVHPDGGDSASWGSVVRLPQTCWLALHDAESPDNVPSRRDIGLPPDAMVLCSLFEPVKLNPTTFAVWIHILRSLPDAVLWLPGCHPVVQCNLSGEARAAGIKAGQIIFSGAMDSQNMMASIQHADLFLDTLRFNAVQGLSHALRMGIPAISCAGSNMASRMGGSLLRAAGLPDCIFDTPQAYAAEVIRLGQSPAVFKALRKRFSAAYTSAPLFDVSTRVKEMETAWTMMVERSRAGLPPTTFHTADFKAGPGFAA